MTATDQRRCQWCGSVFPHHRCGAPRPADCTACHHPLASHHRTDAGRVTYCTVWSVPVGGKAAVQCACKEGTHG